MFAQSAVGLLEYRLGFGVKVSYRVSVSYRNV